tara:strand:- start:528 stop:806 length:279 start_codon:yes stop_codon:yes gene_type:complete
MRNLLEEETKDINRIKEIMGIIVEKKKHTKEKHDDKDGAFTVPVKVKGVDDVEGDEVDSDDSTTTTTSSGGSSTSYGGDMGGAGAQDAAPNV